MVGYAVMVVGLVGVGVGVGVVSAVVVSVTRLLNILKHLFFEIDIITESSGVMYFTIGGVSDHFACKLDMTWTTN
jgi:hypothetical protein